MMKRKGVFLACLLILTTFLLAACGGDQTKQDSENNNDENKLSGNIKLAGSTSVQPLAEELAMRFMELNRDVKIDVVGGGSGAGVESAGNGAADIGMASREVKDKEMETYKDIKPIVIAKDGIVVVVNKENQISGLNMEEIQKIFTGEITNWSQVGGSDANITVINREEGSGTRGAFREIVVGKKNSFTDKAAIQNSTGAVKTAVSSDPNSIGYISMGAMSSDVKGLQVNGAEPNVDNVLNGSYKIARPFNFITKGQANGLNKAFIDWVFEDEAQNIVNESGFISVK